uniref:Uncharacterized protein n=1 Tax=Glossina austeni TaxID=7395 RepID=A0A1A9UUI0_GLOAU
MDFRWRKFANLSNAKEPSNQVDFRLDLDVDCQVAKKTKKNINFPLPQILAEMSKIVKRASLVMYFYLYLSTLIPINIATAAAAAAAAAAALIRYYKEERNTTGRIN